MWIDRCLASAASLPALRRPDACGADRSRVAPKPAESAGATLSAKNADLDQRLQNVRIAVFRDLIDSVDLTELGRLDPSAVREEISDIVFGNHQHALDRVVGRPNSNW